MCYRKEAKEQIIHHPEGDLIFLCISFHFYGVFWSNLNSQLFIFTKENKIAVARLC